MNVKVLDTMFPSVEIHIRSDDYKHKIGSNDFLFEIHETIRNPDPRQYYMTAELSCGEFPVSFFNVNATNNILYFNYEDDDKILIIPVGNYNMGQLLTKFDGLLTAYNFTNKPVINWSSVDNKFSISFTTAYIIKPNSTCFKLFGILSTQTLAGVGILTGDSMCDIRGYTNLFIQTDLFSNGYSANTQKDNNSHNTLARVPVDAGAYGTVLYRPNAPHSVPIPKSAIRAFRISIRDFEGNIIDMNFMKWTMTITIHFHKINSVFRDYKSTEQPTGGFTTLNSSGVATQHLLKSWIDSITNEYKNGNLDYSRLTMK